MHTNRMNRTGAGTGAGAGVGAGASAGAGMAGGAAGLDGGTGLRRAALEAHAARAGLASPGSSLLKGSSATPYMQAPQSSGVAMETVIPGQSQWTAAERRALQEAMAKYPEGRTLSLTRFIAIARHIKGKSVRDVAIRLTAMANTPGGKQSPMHNTVGATHSPAGSAQAGLHGHAALPSHMLGTAAAASTTATSSSTTAGGVSSSAGLATSTPQTSTQAASPGSSQLHAGSSVRPPPSSATQNPMINSLVQENQHVLTLMHKNLVAGQLDQNLPLMCKFRDNVHVVLDWLQSLNDTMPPLPVEVNTVLLPPSPRNIYPSTPTFSSPHGSAASGTPHRSMSPHLQGGSTAPHPFLRATGSAPAAIGMGHVHAVRTPGSSPAAHVAQQMAALRQMYSRGRPMHMGGHMSPMGAMGSPRGMMSPHAMMSPHGVGGGAAGRGGVMGQGGRMGGGGGMGGVGTGGGAVNARLTRTMRDLGKS